MPIDWTSFSPVEEPQSEDTIDWSGFSPVEQPTATPVPTEIPNGGGYSVSPVVPKPTSLPRGEDVPESKMAEIYTAPRIKEIPMHTEPAKTIPGAVLNAADNTAAGLINYSQSLQGGTEMTGAAIPGVNLLVLGKWAHDMYQGGKQSLENIKNEVANMLGESISRKMAQANNLAPQPPVDPKTMQQHIQNIANDVVNSAAMGLGAAGAAGHFGKTAAGLAGELIPNRIPPTPETPITKVEPNAVPVESSGSLSPKVSPENSSTVGEGIPAPSEPALPQEQAIAPVEATPATEGALKRGDIDPVMGARFDGEVMGRKMFTAMLPDGTPGTTFVVDAKATPEQMRAKYESVRKNFDGDKNQPRPLPEEKPTPSSTLHTFDDLHSLVQERKAQGKATFLRVSDSAKDLANPDYKSKIQKRIPDAEHELGMSVLPLWTPDESVQQLTGGMSKMDSPENILANSSNYLHLLTDKGKHAWLVEGDISGIGYDGEPVLSNVKKVGELSSNLGADMYRKWAESTGDKDLIGRVNATADKMIKASEKPIESRGAAGGNMGMNAIFDPANYKPQIEFAKELYGKAKDFVSWSGEMIGKFGESIKQHLRDIWDHVRGVDSEPAEVSRMSPDEFNKFAPTGATNKGYELAKRIGVEGDRSRLPEYEQRVVDQLQESMKKLATAKPEEQAQIFKDGQILNTKKQYFNEANRMLTTADLVNKGMSMADAAKQTGVLLPELEKFFEGPKGLAKNVRSVEGGIKEGGSIINPGGELAKLAERLGGKVTGLAERIRARREAAGMTATTVPGEGLSPEASVQKGRARIAAGENPESAMTEFEQTKRLNSGDIELVRAHTENLARATNQALDQFGRQSEQFKTAHKIESDWAKRTKAMQTEWARQGHAQQGEVDIDTGTFSGLSRYKEQVSKTPFTPEQEVTAKKKAKVAKDATDKADVTQQVLLDHIEKKATAGNAEKRAKDAADKTVRENAVRLADAENAHRTAQQTRDNGIAKIESDAEKRAGDAASKTVRENAIRVAKEENAARIKQMQRDVDVAAMAEKRAKDALDAANKRARDVAARAAREEQRRQADPLAAIWEKAKGYIEQGMDNFDDIRAKLATDLGMPIERVTRMLAQDKRAKFLTDEAWRAQERARMVKQQAKAWVRSLDIPGYVKAIKMVPKLAFTAKVMGHGPVALGTHAPMLAFQPPFWKMYLQNYAKMYRMVGKPTPKGQANAKAFYESKVQDLLHDPLYTTAQRAGLINDPMHFEDYNSPEMMAWMGKFTAMGNRGYSVLKMIRQDMFNYHWNKLPKTMQTSGVAEAIADSVNHATGVVSTTPIQGSHLAFFAPRLEMSRAAWLAADPMKALATVPRWSKATDAQKWAAIQQAKEKAWVAGTMLGMLAINQGILNAVNSEQKINFDDPLKSDFLKFKVAGMKASYGNAMLSMARLVPRLIDAREGSAARLKNREYPDESVYKLAGEYARSQMAPAASIAADLFLKSDFQHRPLPNSDQDVPKRLRDQGVTPYTWPEYWLEKATPIPVEEGIKEVYKNGLGMTDEQMKRTRMAVASIIAMGTTGGNLTEDYPAQLRDMIKPDSKASNQEIVDAFKKLVINEPTPEKKQKRINQILSENNPFTADGEPKAFMTTSKEKEEKFVEGLSPKKKEEYKQALIERAKSYQRLQDALNSAK